MAVTLTTLLGCADPGPIVIAAPGAWDEPGGRLLRMGMEMALDEINASGGVRGRRLVVDYLPLGRTDLPAAVPLAEAIVSRPEVSIVVGHTGSASASAALSVYRGRIPAILTRATSASWEMTPPWAFFLAGAAERHARSALQLVAEQGWDGTAIIFDNTPQARNWAEALQTILEPVTLFQPIFTEDVAGSHDPIVQAVVQRESEAVVLFVGERNAGVLLPLVREHGPDVAIVGPHWDNMHGRPEMQGVFTIMPGFLTSEGEPEDSVFRSRFETRYGEGPKGLGAFGYDGIRLAARAIEEAGPDRSAIRDWLSGTRSTPVEGVTGPIAFDSVGNRTEMPFEVHRICIDGRSSNEVGCR